jgi:hypothetical protein
MINFEKVDSILMQELDKTFIEISKTDYNLKLKLNIEKIRKRLNPIQKQKRIEDYVKQI